MKKLQNILPKNNVSQKEGKWFFEGMQIGVEELDHLAGEAEVFKKSFLYKMWQGYLRTKTITAIIKDSKDFRDVENGKALLIALDTLDNMMHDIIKQQQEIVKKKK